MRKKCAAKNPNRGRNTRKLTAHGCCEGAAAPNAGMFCPKRQGITAGSPEGGQRVAMRKVLWQDKPIRAVGVLARTAISCMTAQITVTK
mgnify:CR=1 FL=1